MHATLAEHQQVQALLRANMLGLALSTVILVAAFVALALWIARTRSKERILLWFGLFALIYSLREFTKNPLIQLTFDISGRSRDWVVGWGDYLVLIPAMLLLEEVFGRGWRSSVRWGILILAAYDIAGLTLGLAAGNPYYWPEPSRGVLPSLVAGLAVVNLAKRYRPPQFADIGIFLMGMAVFVAFVLDQHYLPERFHAEPLGFFGLLCSLGVIAVRRSVRNEKKLLLVEQEMASAQQIQSSILPSDVPRLPGLTIAARYLPMTSVAGDFYDFAVIDSSTVGFLIADVAGHGVPAALIASMVKVAFASERTHASNPGLVLSGLNRIFCQQLRGQYLTAGYLVIDHVRRSAVYAGAGHPPLIVWRASSGKVDRYENNGLFLGLRPSEVYPNLEISLSPGDRLMLYTDGLLEATNRADESFGDSIDSRIAAHGSLPAVSFADALLNDLHTWKCDQGQDDDLTLLVVDV